MSVTSLSVDVFRNPNYTHQLHASGCKCSIPNEYEYLATFFNYANTAELIKIEAKHDTQTMKCLRGY